MNKFTQIHAALQAATASVAIRSIAGSAQCALIGMVANTINREQKALAQQSSETYATLRDTAQDDTNGDAPLGTANPLTLPLLVEFTAAVRGAAATLASGFEGPDRVFAMPQDIAGSVTFMATPRSKVTKEQIEQAREIEPDLSDADAVSLIQGMMAQDAAKIGVNAALITDRVDELLRDAPADREIDSIFADLPEAYQLAMLTKAYAGVNKEISRLLPFAIRGVPGTASKRTILKLDLPLIDELFEGTGEGALELQTSKPGTASTPIKRANDGPSKADLARRAAAEPETAVGKAMKAAMAA